MLGLLLVTDDLDVARTGQEARLVPAYHEVVDDLAKRLAIRGEADVLLTQESESLVDSLLARVQGEGCGLRVWVWVWVKGRRVKGEGVG